MFSAAGAVGFLVAAVIVASAARAHQLSGTMMSNGKGGTMAPSDGYLIAVTLFVMGVGYGCWVGKLIGAEDSAAEDERRAMAKGE